MLNSVVLARGYSASGIQQINAEKAGRVSFGSEISALDKQQKAREIFGKFLDEHNISFVIRRDPKSGWHAYLEKSDPSGNNLIISDNTSVKDKKSEGEAAKALMEQVSGKEIQIKVYSPVNYLLNKNDIEKETLQIPDLYE